MLKLNKKIISSLLLICTALSFMPGCSRVTASNPKEVVIYSAGPDNLIKKITKNFTKKTGIKVKLFNSTTGKIMSRLKAEKSNSEADVAILASLSSAIGLKKDGMTEPYSNAKNADKLFTNWKDKDNNYFAYSGSALAIVYNTKLVKNPPKDWDDLTSTTYRNKINISDPSQSGSCLDFISGYANINGEKAWKYFKTIKNNGAEMAGANNEALTPVITGEKSIVLAGVDYMTYQKKNKGEPVDLIYPSSGTVISPRPALILKGSKDKENAEKFIDYLLSDEAQKTVSDEYLLPGRKDIAPEGKPTANDIKSLNVDWQWTAKNNKAISNKFIEMFK
ncbi:ABC transporter substrate-binding protein [Clostridium felsineum]|uniref:ABC transporter substrate-binding protein n=1 Tax=Clostridium felsineum TaxID=36839 RepID=UPI00214D2244|nr:ABC transporter substrate-binding protein [Clostridium felsineum]MCR3759692.1 ABC transporter substrate-binding protein [Clostridium felsineum]